MPRPAAPAPDTSHVIVVRAGFGQRLGASLIDRVGFAIFYLILRALAGQVVSSIVTLLVGLAYFSLLEGSASGQTIGKRLVGIRVADASSNGPLGFGRAFLRDICRYLSTIPLFLGYFWMLWDENKQTWHDKIAKAVVNRV